MASKHILNINSGSVKRIMIDRANARLIIYISVAVFLVVFSLVAAKTLFGQIAYQENVIGERNKALKQLEANLDVVKKLEPSYNSFVSSSTNAIGGNSFGLGPQDGNNAKIILDALPDKYDFPGLTMNIEQLVNDQQVALTSIAGTDDEVAQSSNTGTAQPKPVEMPFQFGTSTDYAKIQAVVGAIERSIRPMKVTKLVIVSGEQSGTENLLTMTLDAVTYYQQAKTLELRKEVVKR